MEPPASFHSLFKSHRPVLALAPMQDITNLPFWKLMTAYGGADLYCTEYFRVLEHSRLDRWILSSLTENPTGRPSLAQMIGSHIPALVRTAKELQQYPIAGIDLNLGCPAPVVYRKCAGGGLLRDPNKVDAMLGALRDAIQIPFTVKTRVGFDDASVFPELLTIFRKHSLDLVTVHGRTVKEGYRGGIHHDLIAEAVAALACPVIANGNVSSHSSAAQTLALTNARGLMIGRGAIRNPWVFRQIREHLDGRPVFHPSGNDLLEYVHALYEATDSPAIPERSQVQNLKKYMNHIGLGIEASALFLHAIRRTETRDDFFRICTEFLSDIGPMSLEPAVQPALQPLGSAGYRDPSSCSVEH